MMTRMRTKKTKKVTVMKHRRSKTLNLRKVPPKTKRKQTQKSQKRPGKKGKKSETARSRRRIRKTFLSKIRRKQKARLVNLTIATKTMERRLMTRNVIYKRKMQRWRLKEAKNQEVLVKVKAESFCKTDYIFVTFLTTDSYDVSISSYKECFLETCNYCIYHFCPRK